MGYIVWNHCHLTGTQYYAPCVKLFDTKNTLQMPFFSGNITNLSNSNQILIITDFFPTAPVNCHPAGTYFYQEQFSLMDQCSFQDRGNCLHQFLVNLT